MTPLEEAKAIWCGQPCAIIANGPSALKHDLGAVRIPTLGVNRVVMSTTYHLICDLPEDQERRHELGILARRGRLFTFGDIPIRAAMQIPIYRGFQGEWSHDITQGAVESVGSVGSVVYVALQLVAWLGSREIYLVAVDLSGDRHSDGTPSSDLATHDRMDALFQRAKAPLEGLGASVRVVSPSRCTAWPQVPFSAVLEASR